MATSFRTDFRAGLLTILQGVQTAHQGLLSAVDDFPPESFATPHAFVAKGMPERLTHSASTRQRVLTARIVVVAKLLSNDQVTSETDVLVDLIVDAVTAAPHSASGSTLIEPVGVEDGPEIPTSDGIVYSAVTIVVEGSVQEGRL